MVEPSKHLSPCGPAAASPFSADQALPQPLRSTKGMPVTTPEAWTERRVELLELFREHIYGRNPLKELPGARYSVEEVGGPAFGGKAERHRIRLDYKGPGGAGAIRVTAYLPLMIAKPKGCFVLIVNRSRDIVNEAESNPREFWPVSDIVSRGYATVAFHYSDVAIDHPEHAFTSGVFAACGPGSLLRASNDWGTVAAWAFGASAVIDCLPRLSRLANVPVVVVGHSRGGKAALWCGAQDQRVALAISNESGSTGAALARTTRGETIRQINQSFPHWFSLNYHKYADRASELPVDQHLLLGLMAPRRVYVSSASEDSTADPKAEFLSCVWASSIFNLHGLNGVGAPQFPAIGECRHEGAVGYHMRAGEHDLRREDWVHFLDYADRHL